MSVLIKGMDMPKEPEQCKLRKVDEESGYIFESARCVINKHYCGCSFPKDCPLVEVPTPHGILVDIDAEIEKHECVPILGEHLKLIANHMTTVIESEE